MRALFVLLGFAAVQAAAVRGKEAASENPIRRIVNLLQAMAKEVEADGEKDEEMHEKYMCYCETNTKTLGTSITELTEKVPQIEASIEEAVATKAQLESDLAKHKEDREAAKKAIADATAQREKEAEEFASESTEDKANIAACSKAIDAIVKGMAGSFLQSDAASALRNLVPQQFGFWCCKLVANRRERVDMKLLVDFSDRLCHSSIRNRICRCFPFLRSGRNGASLSIRS